MIEKIFDNISQYAANLQNVEIGVLGTHAVTYAKAYPLIPIALVVTAIALAIFYKWVSRANLENNPLVSKQSISNIPPTIIPQAILSEERELDQKHIRVVEYENLIKWIGEEVLVQLKCRLDELTKYIDNQDLPILCKKFKQAMASTKNTHDIVVKIYESLINEKSRFSELTELEMKTYIHNTNEELRQLFDALKISNLQELFIETAQIQNNLRIQPIKNLIKTVNEEFDKEKLMVLFENNVFIRTDEVISLLERALKANSDAILNNKLKINELETKLKNLKTDKIKQKLEEYKIYSDLFQDIQKKTLDKREAAIKIWNQVVVDEPDFINRTAQEMQAYIVETLYNLLPLVK